VGVWFNDCCRARWVTWLCGMSVALSIYVYKLMPYLTAALEYRQIDLDLAYLFYAVSDCVIAFSIIAVTRKQPKYWAIPFVFLISVLTHFTFVYYLISDSNPIPIGVYLNIMVSLNVFVILYIGILSNGFRRCVQYISNIVSRAYRNSTRGVHDPVDKGMV